MQSFRAGCMMRCPDLGQFSQISSLAKSYRTSLLEMWSRVEGCWDGAVYERVFLVKNCTYRQVASLSVETCMHIRM